VGQSDETGGMGRHTRRGILGAAAGLAAMSGARAQGQEAAVIVRNAKITTLDPSAPDAAAVAVADGRFVKVGSEAEVMPLRGAGTTVIDAGGRRIVPGLIDSHQHLIRGGLNYNMELRWDGVPSLADGMRMLKEQAQRTPAPQWVRVVGGFTEHQFAEKRLPTLAELNEAAPDTPVFILHLYDRALLNRAALRAVGYTRDTPEPMGGMIERDTNGEPTGLLLARPNALILYATLAKGPKLPLEWRINSTRHFMRELNRLGVTSAIDAGGGYQNYPEDYQVIEQLAAQDQLTVRIAYNLFTQKPKEELADFRRWTGMVRPGQGSDMYRHNGAGEMLVFSAADFEDFREPRPDLAPSMEAELEPVIRVLAENRWPFRLHATYDETISRALDVFERVHRDVPLTGLNWFFDHAETVTPRNINRIAALGGGIATQHRMAFQGEYFAERYGIGATAATPPIQAMLAAGLPVGAGTDATRVASYNPWVSLWWLVSGRTVGGLEMYPPANRLDRETALRLWTEGSAWFSSEAGRKGRIAQGQLADLVVLSEDYMSVDEPRIRHIESVLTVVGGNVVHGADGYQGMAPPLPPAAPEWSPVGYYGGYQRADANPATVHAHAMAAACACGQTCGVHGHAHGRIAAAPVREEELAGFWGVLGCSCWAV
jgi:predicted amidohydrolase YtcJ